MLDNEVKKMATTIFSDPLTLKISRAMRKRLDALTAKAGTKRATIVRLAVSQFLEENGEASGEELLTLRDRAEAADFVESKLGSEYAIVKKGA